MNGHSHSRRGFSLVEVALALGVTSFALITIVGLLPLGIGTLRQTVEETAAINIATGVVADLHQAPSAAAIALNSSLSPKSPLYGVDVTQPSATIYLDGNGTLEPSAATARYQANIVLTAPPAGARNATEGSVIITWPPGNSVNANSVSLLVALDRN
jgi:uncharacterized protein (TIGR02598 family)